MKSIFVKYLFDRMLTIVFWGVGLGMFSLVAYLTLPHLGLNQALWHLKPAGILFAAALWLAYSVSLREERMGRDQQLLVINLSRMRVVNQKYLSGFVSIVLIAATGWVIGAVVATILHQSSWVMEFATSLVVGLGLALASYSLVFAAAAGTGSRLMTWLVAVTCVVGLAATVINCIGQDLLDGGQTFSHTVQFFGQANWQMTVGMVAAIVLGWMIGTLLYLRRDYRDARRF